MEDLFGGRATPPASETWMTRYFRPMVVGFAAVVALILTVAGGGTDGGLGLTTPSSLQAAPAGGGSYDPAAFNLFERVLGRVTQSYVEPERIKPRHMLLEALHAVERSVPEVLVKESADRSRVTVRVQDAERGFDVTYVDSPWNLSSVMRGILAFVAQHVQASTKVQDVEYAAINGMLGTLDPHSVLLGPDIYNEMKLQTRGEFGGLGIVISMIDGVLTVLKTMDGTPAAGAQIKACDQILKIGQESTVNMTLSQAVQRLRGAPESNVTITLLPKGSAQSLRKTLQRDVIKIRSVKVEMLDKKVGYIWLESFQGNSLDDLREQLGKLQREGMVGLVLDLRGNPGGLLDQAIKIADMFVDSGTLVTTVSHAGRRREEKRARRDSSDAHFPMAVLVDSGSASASEIVAGALKNLDRAVVIGRRTFGKGSVQVLYDNSDGSALKLTIAQYLTPGDVSIQSVGITPDVGAVPVIISKESIRLRRNDKALRENDLQKHLTHRNARRQRSEVTVHYLDGRTAGLASQPDPHADDTGPQSVCLFPERKCKPDDERPVQEDFMVRVARDLVAQAKGWRRSQLLATDRSFFGRVEAEQEERIAATLRQFDVDWAAPPAATSKPTGAGAPRLAVSVQSDPPGLQGTACSVTKVRVTVRNAGTAPAYRLAAITDSSNPSFSNKELVFGRVDPGQARSWTLPVRVTDVPTRVDEVKLKFSDALKTVYPVTSFQMSVRGLERPVFAYGYQLLDDAQGNRDGRAQRGERVRLLVTVRNTGAGAAFRAITTLQNLSGVGIFVRKGRFVLGRLEPGQTKTVDFTFDVEAEYDKKDFTVELAVYDDGLQEAVSEKLEFPVAPAGEGPRPATGVVRVARGPLELRAWGAQNAPVVGDVDQGAVLKLIGKLGTWNLVEAEANRTAFVAASAVEGARGAPRAEFHRRWQVTPPQLALTVPTYATDKPAVRISGQAVDDASVADVFIFVRNREAKIEGRKVFYQSNRRGRTPKELRFAADVPLWPGANYITVFARENHDVQAHQMAVVYRREPPREVAGRVEGAGR